LSYDKPTIRLLIGNRSEAAEGVIPSVINIPQKSKYGLYTERISGSSFTAPRKDSKQTWLYRLLPSTNHEEFSLIESHPFNLNHAHDSKFQYSPSPSTWAPVRIAKEADFLSGLQMIGGAGNPTLKEGLAYYVFTAGKSMPPNQAFYSADGDFLLGMPPSLSSAAASHKHHSSSKGLSRLTHGNGLSTSSDK
jgi:homogentisate 1,2-dioxygenase